MPKRQKRSYQHHHVLKHKGPSMLSKEPALLDAEAVDKLLIEGIKDVLEEEGLKQNVYDPQIESLALEAFRNAVEECMSATNQDWPSTDRHRPFERLLQSPQVHARRASHSAHRHRLRVCHSCARHASIRRPTATISNQARCESSSTSNAPTGRPVPPQRQISCLLSGPRAEWPKRSQALLNDRILTSSSSLSTHLQRHSRLPTSRDRH